MESNCAHSNSLAVMSRAENRTPRSHFLGFASAYMPSEPVFCHAQEAQPGLSRGELRILSLWQLLTPTPVRGDRAYRRAASPVIPAQAKREGGEVRVIYFDFSYFCSVF